MSSFLYRSSASSSSLSEPRLAPWSSNKVSCHRTLMAIQLGHVRGNSVIYLSNRDIDLIPKYTFNFLLFTSEQTLSWRPWLALPRASLRALTRRAAVECPLPHRCRQHPYVASSSSCRPYSRVCVARQPPVEGTGLMTGNLHTDKNRNMNSWL